MRPIVICFVDETIQQLDGAASLTLCVLVWDFRHAACCCDNARPRRGAASPLTPDDT